MIRWVAAFGLACGLCGCDSRAEPSAFAGPARVAFVRATTPLAPLRIAFSDRPGWTAFEIGIQKGWFKKAGVDVEFSWQDYLPSLDAFSSGTVDAVMTSNADALTLGADGAKNKMILVTDYSNGNDKIVARSGIDTFKDLKGKKIGLELTLVEHLLFLKACEKNGMTSADVELLNFPTDATPQALASGEVAAIGAWYPAARDALRYAARATPVFTSADVPGLIYDAVAVAPTSFLERRDDWAKFVKVWYRISDFVRNPQTRDQAIAIMAARAGATPDEYAAAMSGTYFLSLDEAKKRYRKSAGLDSLYGSTSVADDFNVANKVYRQPQPVDDYVEPAIVTSL
jgi:NitT/TauT family transport system substrate-binding protein